MKAKKSPLLEIPNVGPATVEDFRKLGIVTPDQLRGRDAMTLYDELCRVTQQRHDPCVVDVFRSAIHFVETGERRKWWDFTPLRKDQQ